MASPQATIHSSSPEANGKPPNVADGESVPAPDAGHGASEAVVGGCASSQPHRLVATALQGPLHLLQPSDREADVLEVEVDGGVRIAGGPADEPWEDNNLEEPLPTTLPPPYQRY